MSDFPKFKDGDEFLRYMEQMVADIKAGRHKPQPYYPIPCGSLAQAEASLEFHRVEAMRLGLEPERVVMLRDPVTEQWTVLIPSEQFSAGLDEVW
jgi:hypothetical protein